MPKPTLIKPNGETAGLRDDQKECIEKLEAALESAKNGDIWSCCIIACGPTDFGLVIAGTDAPRINIGLDAAKTEIMSRVLGKRTVLHR